MKPYPISFVPSIIRLGRIDAIIELVEVFLEQIQKADGELSVKSNEYLETFNFSTNYLKSILRELSNLRTIEDYFDNDILQSWGKNCNFFGLDIDAINEYLNIHGLKNEGDF